VARTSPSVLLVEDDELIQQIMCELLQQLSITEIHGAGDGVEALKQLKDSSVHPDVIICDVYMPHMDGVEFIGHLEKIQYKGGVVLVSGLDPSIMQISCDLANAKGLRVLAALVKPITRADLEEVFARFRAQR